MDFTVTQDHKELREAIASHCAKYPDEYWAEKDRLHEFPQDFLETFADAGFLGLALPEEYGGGGLGVTEAAIMMETIAASGGGLSACSTVHMPVFGLLPIVHHGSESLKQRFLPRAAEGRLRVSFAVTEPTAGTDMSRLSTTARKVDGGWLINGQKMWISGAQGAERLLIIARTTPREDCTKPTDGMTLFFAENDKDHVTAQEISKIGRHAVDSNMLFIDDLFVADEDVVGEVGRGFRCLLDGLNGERVLVAAECLGIGRAALRRAVDYANERIVFDRPIGMNQGVQFPLAQSLADLDAAELVMRKAAWLFDQGLPAGREANSAKLLCSTAGFNAADRAIQVHGGMGYATEYHVGRYWHEVRLLRITPIANELVLSYLAEHVLGLPRSY
ncbi:acyl-CoA dehydrogenase family protein [Nocardioides sp. 31GB23]|uniref:acyl-CoA dehydrogenase family protein n=1 Tax=Nocardioides sp. 31GB23 TaxID=3156065 RepID=UPI0032AF7667